MRTRAPATGSRRLTEPPRSLWQISARRFGRNLPPLARTWQTLADITLLGSAKLTVPVDINRRTAQQLEASANPTTPTDMGDTMSDATNNSLRRRRSRATTCVALAAAATAAAALAVPRYRRNHRGIWRPPTRDLQRTQRPATPNSRRGPASRRRPHQRPPWRRPSQCFRIWVDTCRFRIWVDTCPPNRQLCCASHLSRGTVEVEFAESRGDVLVPGASACWCGGVCLRSRVQRRAAVGTRRRGGRHVEPHQRTGPPGDP